MWRPSLRNFSNTNLCSSVTSKRYVSSSSSIHQKSVQERVSKDGELRVFIVAGEVSGDNIGSRLMASLRTLSSLPLRFSGVGGSMMFNQGLKSLFPMEDIAVMGIWELLPHLRKIRAKLREMIDAALLFQPHVVVTVDSKGFSFRLLKQLRSKYTLHGGPLHFHYVAPSFWAWKGGEKRLGNLAKFVDHMFCILPNEEEVCRSNGLDATYVGHPIIEDALDLNRGKDTSSGKWEVSKGCESFLSEYQIPSDASVISLLPGSRFQEVSRMLPIFADTIKLLKEAFPKLFTLIHVAPNQDVEKCIDGVIQKWPAPAILIPGGKSKLKYNAFNASRVALCTSGTVAMELQLARLPCVVAYRAHLLTELFVYYKAKIPYMSLPNILLNSAVIPEALFHECTPSKLACLLREIMLDEESREKQIIASEKVIEILWSSKRIAEEFSQADFCKDYPNHYPSLIAASTLLHHVKPQ